jgi:hypothetical protein
MDVEHLRISEDVVMACFMVLSQHLPEDNLENHDITPSR